MPGDCVSLDRRLTAVHTVSARRSVHGGSQLGNCGPVALSWKRAELDPEVSLVRSTEVGRDRGLEATSATTDQVALETLGACSSWWAIRRCPGLKRLQVGQPGSAVVRVGRPGGLAALLQRSHEGTTIRVRFRRSRRSTPPDCSDGLWAHLATLAPSRDSVSRLTNEAPASEEAGCTRVAEATARPGAGGPRGARCVRRLDLASRSQVLTGVSGAHRGGLRIDAVSGLAGRMSVQL